jgi:hypothetical protein
MTQAVAAMQQFQVLPVEEELAPALRTLAHPALEADELLLALRCRANQYQYASRVRVVRRRRAQPFWRLP